MQSRPVVCARLIARWRQGDDEKKTPSAGQCGVSSKANAIADVPVAGTDETVTLQSLHGLVKHAADINSQALHAQSPVATARLAQPVL